MYSVLRKIIESELHTGWIPREVLNRYVEGDPTFLPLFRRRMRNVLRVVQRTRKNGGFIVIEDNATVLHICSPYDGEFPHRKTFFRDATEHPLLNTMLLLAAIARVPVVDARGLPDDVFLSAPLWSESVPAMQVIRHYSQHGAIVRKYGRAPVTTDDVTLYLQNKRDHTRVHVSTPNAAYVYYIDSFTTPLQPRRWITRVQNSDFTYSASFDGYRAYDNEGECLREVMRDVLLIEAIAR